MSRPTKVIVNRQAIKNNLALANSIAPTSKLVSVIKANAYGHGLIEIAKTLSDSTEAFGVACIEEAISIRNAGIENPILLMEGLFTEDELQVASEKNFWLMVEKRILKHVRVCKAIVKKWSSSKRLSSNSFLI